MKTRTRMTLAILGIVLAACLVMLIHDVQGALEYYETNTLPWEAIAGVSLLAGVLFLLYRDKVSARAKQKHVCIASALIAFLFIAAALRVAVLMVRTHELTGLQDVRTLSIQSAAVLTLCSVGVFAGWHAIRLKGNAEPVPPAGA